MRRCSQFGKRQRLPARKRIAAIPCLVIEQTRRSRYKDTSAVVILCEQAESRHGFWPKRTRTAIATELAQVRVKNAAPASGNQAIKVTPRQDLVDTVAAVKAADPGPTWIATDEFRHALTVPKGP